MLTSIISRELLCQPAITLYVFPELIHLHAKRHVKENVPTILPPVFRIINYSFHCLISISIHSIIWPHLPSLLHFSFLFIARLLERVAYNQCFKFLCIFSESIPSFSAYHSIKTVCQAITLNCFPTDLFASALNSLYSNPWQFTLNTGARMIFLKV